MRGTRHVHQLNGIPYILVLIFHTDGCLFVGISTSPRFSQLIKFVGLANPVDDVYTLPFVMSRVCLSCLQSAGVDGRGRNAQVCKDVLLEDLSFSFSSSLA